MNAHSNCIYQQLKAGNNSNVHQLVNGQKIIVVYPYSVILLSNEKKHITTWMNFKNNYAEYKKPESLHPTKREYYMISFIENSRKYKLILSVKKKMMRKNAGGRDYRIMRKFLRITRRVCSLSCVC